MRTVEVEPTPVDELLVIIQRHIGCLHLGNKPTRWHPERVLGNSVVADADLPNNGTLLLDIEDATARPVTYTVREYDARQQLVSTYTDTINPA